MWMVRAEGGELLSVFRRGYVAIGWFEVGDLTELSSREAIRDRYDKSFADDSPVKAANAAGMLLKFRSLMERGDEIVTYDPQQRQYLLGKLTSDYRYDPSLIDKKYPHVRTVEWFGRADRDKLTASTRNTLGSTLTVFSVNEDAAMELLDASEVGDRTTPLSPGEIKIELDVVKEDASAKAFELIKDAVVARDDRELEQLVASILRAMGYRARVTPVGPDRGVDVIASPDGLGLEEPRIKAEVKHRPKAAMGSSEVRSFLGGLRQGDRGIYVSTGGFTREARYEAERANVPVTLIDLDDLVSLIVTHYESFDVEGRVALPLTRVYIPAE
jgi:restriction system protein